MDRRELDIVSMLGCAPFEKTNVVLDVGMGTGGITRTIAERVRFVVGTGLRMNSYGTNAEQLAKDHIVPAECLIEKLPFANETFDAVVLSHVLEHCPNVGLALAEVRRVLRKNGLLCVFVPPHEPLVCGGHIAIGWHIGQLMYVLLLAGFNVTEGNFIKRGYNVCGFVRKDPQPLPKLRFDFGDIRTLAEHGRWPLPITNADPKFEAFYGDLRALNWPWPGLVEPEEPPPAFGPRSRLIRRVVPEALRPKIRTVLSRLSQALAPEPPAPRELVNPKTLKM